MPPRSTFWRGKHVAITGAASGIGAAVAAAVAARGAAAVTVLDVDAATADATAAALRAAHPACLFTVMQCDVTVYAQAREKEGEGAGSALRPPAARAAADPRLPQVSAAVDAAIDAIGPIDVMVANAGIAPCGEGGVGRGAGGGRAPPAGRTPPHPPPPPARRHHGPRPPG